MLTRKFLAILLALAMLLPGSAVTAFADAVPEAQEPAVELIEEPVSEPAEEPVSEPAEEPVSEPAEEPVAEPAEEPVSEPAEEPVSEPAEDYLEDANDPLKATKIEIVKEPDKLYYLRTDTKVDLSGIEIEATTADGRKFDVYWMNDGTITCTKPDFTRLGEKEVTVTFQGQTDTFKINVVAKAVKSLAVTTRPDKLDYFTSDTKLDLKGLVVTATMSDNTLKVIPAKTTTVTDGYTVGSVSFSTAGNKTVKINYNGTEATFDISVAEVAAESISVAPEKIYFKTGTAVSYSGITVKALGNDGKTRTVSNSDAGLSFSPLASAVTEDTAVTVTYQGKTATFNVVFVDYLPTGITIKTKPKVSYIAGQKFDPTGLVVTVNYGSGAGAPASENVTYGEDTANGFTFSPGLDTELKTTNRTVAVTYKGKSASLSVTVAALTATRISVTEQPERKDYFTGTKFDPVGLELLVDFNDGRTDVPVVYDSSTKSSFSFSPATLTESTTSVAGTYCGKSFTISGIKTYTLPGAMQIYSYDGEIIDKAEITVGETNPKYTTLKCEMSPRDTTGVVVSREWTSSDESVLTIDETNYAGKYAVMNPIASGKVTVTVRTVYKGGLDLDTTSIRKDSITVTVYRFAPDKTMRIWLDPAAPTSAGYASGSTAQVKFSVGGAAQSDSSLISVKSSNTSVARVYEENNKWMVEFLEPHKTAILTAKLLNDAKGRAAAVSVKVTAPPVDTVTIDGEDSYKFVYSELSSGRTVQLTAKTFREGIEQLTGVVWSSSNTSVATVSATGLVTVKGAGVAEIIATANDYGKAKSTPVTVTCVDYTPKLSAVSVTVNKAADPGEATLSVIPMYGGEIEAVPVILDAYGDDGLFTLTATNGYGYYISAGPLVPAGTYKMFVSGQVGADGEQYDFSLPLTIKVVSTLPKLTVKQNVQINSFYSDDRGMGVVTVTAPAGVTITGFGTDSEDYALVNSIEGPNSVTRGIKLTAEPGSDYEKKLTLNVSVEGYGIVELQFSPKVVKQAPKLTLAPSSVTLYKLAAPGTDEPYALFEVNDSTDRNNVVPVALTEAKTVSANKCLAENQYAAGSDVLDSSGIKLNPVSSGSVKVNVLGAGWNYPVAVNCRVSVNSSLPSVKAKSPTLTLNNNFPSLAAETELTVSATAAEITADAELTSLAKAGSKAAFEAGKLEVAYNDGKITASIKPGQIPAAGSYKFQLTNIEAGYGYSFSEEEAGGGVALKPLTVTVKVDASLPAVKATPSGLTLNTIHKGTEAAEAVIAIQPVRTAYLKEHLENAELDYAATAATAQFGSKVPEGSFIVSAGDGVLKVKLDAGFALRAGSYPMTITPVIDAGADTGVSLKPIKINVTVANGGASVRLRASGKIDLVNPASFIEYTPTLVKASGGIFSVDFADDPASQQTAELYSVALFEGKIYLTAKLDVESSAAQQRFKLKYVIAGEPENYTIEPETYISFKPTASSAKLTASRKDILTFYQGSGTGHKETVTYTITAPQNAEIERVDAKLTAAQAEAFAYTYTIDDTGFYPTVSITISVKNAAKVKAGVTQSLAFELVLKGAPESAKPAKVTVKAVVKK